MTQNDYRYSYSSTRMTVAGRANELYLLARTKMTKTETLSAVDDALATVEATERRVREVAGLRLENLKMLDVGPGQQLRHMRCFATKNEPVGIDLDVVPQGKRLGDYVRLVRYAPLTRVVKTLARKAMRHDRRFAVALARRLGLEHLVHLPVMRMDATRMSFPSESFDFVCSYSAFEHIGDPRAALEEITRVLRPGGAAYVRVHLYTSHSGAHDPKIMSTDVVSPPYWPHLRPALRDTVEPSTYLNRLSLGAWRALFGEVMPGVRFFYERQEQLVEPLRELRARGELAEFADDELLTLNLAAVWKKPAATARRAAA